MSKPGAQRLRSMLARNHRFAESITQAGFPLPLFEQLQDWQRARLARSFEELERKPDCGPAVQFFLTELYGGLGFRERDQDLDRVMHLMIRFLPDRTLWTMSEAFELQAISLEFDRAMALQMQQDGIDALDMPTYCAVYRAAGDRPGRERQIELIRKLGYDLDKLVRLPLVSFLVRLLHAPAHAAGFGALQDFLEQGLAAFREMDDVRHFIETIYEREWAAMEALFAGAERPFGF